MNLLFLNSIEKETFGGMEEWIRLVAAGLVERGHKVTVAGRPGSQFLGRVSAHSGVTLLPIEISGDFNPTTIARLGRYLKDNSIDTVVVNFNKDLRLGGIAARLEGDVRVVWSVGLDITKDSFIHKFLTPRLVDGVIVPSKSLKSQITRLGYISSDIVKVIPIGIPDTNLVRTAESRTALRRKYGLPDDAILAVTVGRLVDQKGHRYLIEAIPEIISVAPNLRFIFCGNGPLETELKALAAKLGTDKYIVFAGMLENVDEAAAGADLMIHPSIEEPFGIALLEGMRAGLPIVASRIGGIPEVLGNTGYLVEPRNPQAIADSVIKLAADPEQLDKAAKAARKRFEQHFKLTGMIDLVEQYLMSVLQAVPRHG